MLISHLQNSGYVGHERPFEWFDARARQSSRLLSQPWQQDPFERFRERALAGIAIAMMAAALNLSA
jgi:hypothetical protein